MLDSLFSVPHTKLRSWERDGWGWRRTGLFGEPQGRPMSSSGHIIIIMSLIWTTLIYCNFNFALNLWWAIVLTDQFRAIRVHRSSLLHIVWFHLQRQWTFSVLCSPPWQYRRAVMYVLYLCIHEVELFSAQLMRLWHNSLYLRDINFIPNSNKWWPFRIKKQLFTTLLCSNCIPNRSC